MINKKQQGAVLLFSMILLLIMTIVSVGSMDTSNLEQKMAGNARDYNLAFQAADSVLRDAEQELHNNIFKPTTSDDGSTGIWTENAMDTADNSTKWWEEKDNSWWEQNSTAKEGLSNLSKPPRYIIEEKEVIRQGTSVRMGKPEVMVNVVHRITSRAVGARDSTVVMIQTTFEKEYEQ